MAKKIKSFSQVEALDALERLAGAGTSASDFVYDLLRIFAGYGDGQIRRTKEGPGNLAKDGETVLVKNLVAYRPAAVNTPDGDCSQMYDIINAMRDDAKIAKHSPRLYITSDGVQAVAYDPKENDWYENTIELLWKDFEFFTPLAGIEKIQYTEEAEADVKSAELMAKLFDDIRRYNDIRDSATVHALNIFMSRLLFCFFAEDTSLFPGENLFTNTLKTHTREDGSDLAEFIDRAFLAMSTDDPAVLDSLPELYKVFPYVNGGLFKDRYTIPTLSRRARTLILNCGEYNWREINPDIFGSMIQAVVTPEQRAGLGMHYTSVPNIEKVIKPLFLDALEEEFTAACTEAREKMAKKLHPDRATQRLKSLLARLSKIKFFDPACGSGNFLIISYKRLRDLEIRIWKAMREIANVAILPFPNITLTQFYGIELDEYACDTATLSLWLAEHQMNVKFNEELFVRPDTLPLKPSGNIVCGNACRLDWNTVCPHDKDDEVYIMGNPPYLGSRNQNDIQKEDGYIATKNLKGYKKLDYIANWFYKAAEYISKYNSKVAFVTTNSICQGEQIEILWPAIDNFSTEIFFAYKSFKWNNNAKSQAQVTVNIIGLANKSNNIKKLYSEKSIETVNSISYRIDSADNFSVQKQTKAITEFFPEMRRGNMPNDKTFLRLSKEQRLSLISKYPGIEKFIRLQIGAVEFTQGIEKYCYWIPDSELEKALSYPPIAIAINHVRDYRLNSPDVTLHSQAEKSHQFREFFECGKSSLLIPIVSVSNRDYIPIGFVPEKTIIPNSAQVIYDASILLFGILTSKMHNLWVQKNAGRFKTDFRYSIFLCYNTFPFPKLTTSEKEELERLAQNILNIREENFDMTLGEMYNPETMPEDLREAHRQLDLAVERIYRPTPFNSDDERLEHLFMLYAKMTKK